VKKYIIDGDVYTTTVSNYMQYSSPATYFDSLLIIRPHITFMFSVTAIVAVFEYNSKSTNRINY
jgi:hypothetical protein